MITSIEVVSQGMLVPVDLQVRYDKHYWRRRWIFAFMQLLGSSCCFVQAEVKLNLLLGSGHLMSSLSKLVKTIRQGWREKVLSKRYLRLPICQEF
jgi:hypothetical protein